MGIESTYFEEVAKRLGFLHRELVERDARIGYLENEVARLGQTVASLAGGGVAGGGTSPSELDQIEVEQNDVGLAHDRTKPVSCKNRPGASQKSAAADHEHQGVHSVYSEDPQKNLFVGEVGIVGTTLGAGLDIHTFNKFLPVPIVGDGGDVADKEDKAPNNAEWRPTSCNDMLVISHPYNPGIVELGCPPDPGVPDVVCNPNRVASILPDCDTIPLVKTFRVDCSGHVCGFELLNFLKPTVGYEEQEGTVTCCDDMNLLVAEGAAFGNQSCTADAFQWKLTLGYKKIKLPDLKLEVGEDPTCSEGETKVVKDLSIAKDPECAPCGNILTIDYACVGGGGGGCTGCTGDLWLVYDVLCESTDLVIKYSKLTFTNGCLTALLSNQAPPRGTDMTCPAPP